MSSTKFLQAHSSTKTCRLTFPVTLCRSMLPVSSNLSTFLSYATNKTQSTLHSSLQMVSRGVSRSTQMVMEIRLRVTTFRSSWRCIRLHSPSHHHVHKSTSTEQSSSIRGTPLIPCTESTSLNSKQVSVGATIASTRLTLQSQMASYHQTVKTASF